MSSLLFPSTLVAVPPLRQRKVARIGHGVAALLNPRCQKLGLGQLDFICAGIARLAAGVGARRTAGLETGTTVR